MLLPTVLFALVTVGFVVPCLIDVVATPGYEVRHLTRRTWIVLLVVFSVFGAIAWLAVGRPVRYRRAAYRPRYLARTVGMAQRDALRRHPAGRSMDALADSAFEAWPAGRRMAPARVIGPDDDPEFISELARRISGQRETGGDSLASAAATRISSARRRSAGR
jgi:hypothetical protein